MFKFGKIYCIVLQSAGGWINQGGEEMMDRVGLESQSGGNINREMKMKTMMMMMMMMTTMIVIMRVNHNGENHDNGKGWMRNGPLYENKTKVGQVYS